MNKIVSQTQIKSTLQSKNSSNLENKDRFLKQRDIDIRLCACTAPAQATYRQLIVLCGKKGYTKISHEEWNKRFTEKDRSTRGRHFVELEREGLIKSIQLRHSQGGSHVLRTTANTYKSCLANFPKYGSNKTPYRTLAHIRHAFEGGSEESWLKYYYDEYKRLAQKAGKGRRFDPEGYARPIKIMNTKSRERIAQSHAEKKWICDPKHTVPLDGAKKEPLLKYYHTSYYSSSKKEPPSRTPARRPDKIIDFDGGFSLNLKNSSIKVCDYQRAEQVARLHESEIRKAGSPLGFLYWFVYDEVGREKTQKLKESNAEKELQKQKALEQRKELDEFATPLLGRHEKEGYTVTKTDQGYSFNFTKTNRPWSEIIGFESKTISEDIKKMQRGINESIHNTRTADPLEESTKAPKPVLRPPESRKEGPSMGDGKPRVVCLSRARSPRDKLRAASSKKSVEEKDRSPQPEPPPQEAGPGQSGEVHHGRTEQPCMERRQPSILDSSSEDVLSRAENHNKDSIRMSASLWE